MRVIVFGGTGWLGHNIVLQLLEAGHDVTICCRGQKKAFADEVAKVKTVYADKHDEAAVRELFRTPYDAVIDSVPTLEAIANIHKYAVNLSRYIHCSSTGGYAPLPFIPCDETAPYCGFNKKGWLGKVENDKEVMRLFHSEGFPATVIRPTYITGPGLLPMDNLGGRRKDYIADILAEKVLDVPDNGLALLQPVQVRDLASAFSLALAAPRSIGQIYNISLSHALTLVRYHEITAAAFGKKANLNFMSVDAMLKKYEGSISEMGLRFLASHMCFSIEKAVRDLGYKPRFTPEEAVVETARWAAEQN